MKAEANSNNNDDDDKDIMFIIETQENHTLEQNFVFFEDGDSGKNKYGYGNKFVEDKKDIKKELRYHTF